MAALAANPAMIEASMKMTWGMDEDTLAKAGFGVLGGRAGQPGLLVLVADPA